MGQYDKGWPVDWEASKLQNGPLNGGHHVQLSSDKFQG